MEVGILGPLTVSAHGRELLLGGAKQRALLALLILRPNELVPTSNLVEGMWGDKAPATAVKAVQGYVSRLRKVLGDATVETRPTGYVLRLAPDSLDADQFERLLEQGRRLLAKGMAEEARRVLRESLALWRGPPFADFRYESFARDETGRLEELRLVALEQRATADLALGRGAEVVGELEALVRAHPQRESLRELLILALYRAGRQAEALAAYQDARTTLADELGLEPSPSLRRLEKAILRQDPALDLIAATSSPPPSPVAPARLSLDSRKTVSVLFCDVVAESALGEQLDAESLRLVMSLYLERATTVVERHGGAVEKFVGDEVMAVFGVPVARDDDALRAVRAAVDLRDSVGALETESAGQARLQVRIGINTGEVVVAEPAKGHGSVTGDPVSVGKRIEEVAGPGEILLGDETHALVAHAVAATRLEPLEFKGKRRSVRAFQLDSVDAGATALPYREDTPLAGRERELERLTAAFSRVAGGTGAERLTIVGEPGIGKSRLARELLAGVATTATIVVGRCPPYGEGITFRPLREVFQIAGRGEDALAANSREVFAATRRVLEELSAELPLVVVFEDVHWAEPTFLDLVEYLAARLGRARVLLLCLARTELVEKRPNWLEVPGTALRLEPLSEADLGLLVASLGVPDAARAPIVAAAEGNPLFAEQLATSAGEERDAGRMPASIRGVLQERLDRLGHQERAVLESAAVAGRSFSLETVLDLTPQDEHDQVQARLLALARRRYVRPDSTTPDEGFRFDHALIRDAAYDGISKARRSDLHARMAARLEAQSAEDAIVGYHLEQAARFRRELGRADRDLAARAGAHLRSAGRQAFGQNDLPATISLLERACELFPDDDAAQPQLWIELSDARFEAGDFGGVVHDLEIALEAARRLGDRPAELRALLQLHFIQHGQGPGTADDNVRFALELMPELEQLGDDQALERGWWLKAYGDYVACRWRESSEALEQALRHARRGRSGQGVVTALAGLLAVTLAYGPTPVPVAIARIEEELELAAGPDRALQGLLGQNLAALLAMQGNSEEARRIYAEAVATYEELDLPMRQATRSAVGAQIELLSGDQVAAEQELRVGIERSDALGIHGFSSALRGLLADVLCTQGRLEEAEALASELSVSAPESELFAQVLWRTTLARVHARRGEIAQATGRLGEAFLVIEGTDCPDLRVASLGAAAEIEMAQGRTAETKQRFEQACEIMRAKGNIVILAMLEAALAAL